ncbi:hypothetical protein XI08_18200 [Bradyrhizobium sp. CCBAU 11361]|nr:hypothetical protein [Bradyrhizobium sp. CCBAU 11361]
MRPPSTFHFVKALDKVLHTRFMPETTLNAFERGRSTLAALVPAMMQAQASNDALDQYAAIQLVIHAHQVRTARLSRCASVATPNCLFELPLVCFGWPSYRL